MNLNHTPLTPPKKQINPMRRFLHHLLIFSILVLTVAHSGAAIKPNIIIIFTDDQGYADEGKFGEEAFTTPNIDPMADERALLRNFPVAQPVCSASRAAILTGCY